MVEKSKRDEDKERKAVVPSHFHVLDWHLRYLSASRPDPSICYMHGLWYPKVSSIALTAFADADHADCQDTRRSTSGSMQFLGDRLVSWSSKRQKSAMISSANVAGKKMDEDATNAEGEENELYRDVNINLEGRDVEMTDAQ
ncbi:uncharacterized mitochondrial protein-like protein [Tanacetum coccineum]